MAYNGLLNGFWLKASMLLLMLLDHIYVYSGFPHKLYAAHVAARIVAPVFAFLAAQAMVYTRSRERYILRLFIFTAIMSLGNIIIFFITKINISNNIFFSLSLGASMIYLKDKLKANSSLPIYIALTAGAVVLSFYCEGGHLIPMSMVIFYYFRGSKPLMHTVYALAAGLPFLFTYALSGTLQTQLFMVFAVIPIMLYNGRRGPGNAFAKYFFYVFYPLHVWFIVLAGFFSSR